MEVEALFTEYTCTQDYIDADVKYISPMLAKELEDEESQDKCFNSADYYIEEKFDGTRATLHFFPDFIRVFSRRVSEKTGWFCENSDSVPHIRDISIPELNGTVIDGEMFIPDRPFKDVASTLNCKWDKAVSRQEEIGKIVFHAFDIIYYKGVRVEMMPLSRRKVYLQKVIDAVNSKYIEMVTYQKCGGLVSTVMYEKDHGNLSEVFNRLGAKKESYPNFYREMMKNGGNHHSLTPRAFYEYIVATGGEGVIVKPCNGKYYQKRGWEYSKVKKFLTREVIVVGFTPPTEEYKGKFPSPDVWDYWEDYSNEVYDLSIYSLKERKHFINKIWNKDEFAPISKFHAKGWVGNIIFAVTITPEEEEKLPKNKKFDFTSVQGRRAVIVGECSGFDEEQREEFSNHQSEYIGKVIEVKANELFKDTGKLRHPRFLRLRPDKSYYQCTWADHVCSEVL